jgi:hypothetical protein
VGQLWWQSSGQSGYLGLAANLGIWVSSETKVLANLGIWVSSETKVLANLGIWVWRPIWVFGSALKPKFRPSGGKVPANLGTAEFSLHFLSSVFIFYFFVEAIFSFSCCLSLSPFELPVSQSLNPRKEWEARRMLAGGEW